MSSIKQHQRSPTSPFSSVQSNRRRRSSYFDDRYYRRYRNNPELASQIYDLTHPEDAVTFAELERLEDIARRLEPYQAAIVRLSEAFTDDLEVLNPT